MAGLVTLSYRVPDLQFDGLALAGDRLRAELHADRRIVFLLELVVSELEHQTALAHVCVTRSYSTRR